ncbi:MULTISPECIES: flagellar basal-body rod protein FlgG [unclassified Hwanghaeella]|jgi:flagellar basal-body rod protein FlgG|uniref:flagellar basal-body rod protein FlgG n=1 Tax=unclassified Hwanghaeella TaxID=2605944 RepID=UPI000C4273E5|nr:flagellar basal-body rod protein FlgG [Rhodospirillaceae bacterium]MAO90397.1 flagellar basal-body rod protein FlgG [Rhodospirillales bacterium]MAX62084.1 flagellar basal-body rod protein FlgG [Rhodospirillaceae bacterium]MBB58054.1 flagellar basal-body rod protein FlgG [Rhodospirillaceae bacterium]HAE03497.1 flagellar basal-body rod protein FlgG [Rhodospirillaceae bacterium]
MRSLSIGATGMLAQQLNVEVISHNIANMNTTSYQRRRAEFQDLLYQNLRRVGSDSSDASTTVPVGVQVGLGVKTAAVYRITEQGNLTLTENPLDVAINGEGYFRITLPSGDTAYSRAGSFQLDGDGDVVTVDGFTVQPGLTVPPNAVDISVNASGEVLVSLDGVTAPSNIGQLELARFPNDAGLLAIGDNLFLETPASGGATVAAPGTAGFGTIQQGFLETSNVNVVEEITNLITAQRAYEMNSKVIETSDQMMSTLTNLR